MKNMSLLLASLLATVGLPAAVADELNNSKDEGEWKFGLGLGLESRQRPYLGVGSEVEIKPAIMIDGGNFFMRGPNLGYRLLSDKSLTFSVLGRYREEDLDSSDSDDLLGVNDRDGTIELGLGVDYKAQLGTWSLTAYTDAGGNHEGNDISWVGRKHLK